LQCCLFTILDVYYTGLIPIFSHSASSCKCMNKFLCSFVCIVGEADKTRVLPGSDVDGRRWAERWMSTGSALALLLDDDAQWLSIAGAADGCASERSQGTSNLPLDERTDGWTVGRPVLQLQWCCWHWQWDIMGTDFDSCSVERWGTGSVFCEYDQIKSIKMGVVSVWSKTDYTVSLVLHTQKQSA